MEFANWACVVAVCRRRSLSECSRGSENNNTPQHYKERKNKQSRAMPEFDEAINDDDVAAMSLCKEKVGAYIHIVSVIVIVIS